MGPKVRDFVEILDYDELRRLKQDLDSGAVALSNFVSQKIEQKRNEHGRFCTTCFSEIDPLRTTTFTLLFGPADFRKKASFCAVDCLEYFLQQLKQL
jgi:hypothetical protein